MYRVFSAFMKLGQTSLDALVAPVLPEETEDMTNYFKNALRMHPEGFSRTITMDGLAPVRISYEPVCDTVGKVVIYAFSPEKAEPDGICLMVNGVEGKEDIAAVMSKVKLPENAWAELSQVEKPVSFTAFFANGRMRDAATITILNTLSNAYFQMFGTNDVEQAED